MGDKRSAGDLDHRVWHPQRVRPQLVASPPVNKASGGSGVMVTASSWPPDGRNPRRSRRPIRRATARSRAA